MFRECVFYGLCVFPLVSFPLSNAELNYLEEYNILMYLNSHDRISGLALLR